MVEAILILVQLKMIADGPPGGVEIAVAVRILRMGWVGGPLGMREEYLKVWIMEATWENYQDTKRWDKLVSLRILACQ